MFFNQFTNLIIVEVNYGEVLSVSTKKKIEARGEYGPTWKPFKDRELR